MKSFSKDSQGNTIVTELQDVETTPIEQTSDLRSYEERIISSIREKYSIDEELAIQRQRDTKPEEFAEYFTFCEECKLKTKV